LELGINDFVLEPIRESDKRYILRKKSIKMTSFLHCSALLALGAVPHGIARRAERSVLARPWGVETRVGVKEDGHQTVHNWRSMLPSRNGSFCQSLVDVQLINGSFQKALLLI
jgi:hypothetical protein